MSDLINRRDAIDAIERNKLGEQWNNRDFFYNIGIERAKAEITALPSAQQWIPCSERLPEESRRYLTTWAHMYATGVDMAQWDGYDWISEADSYMTDDVIAWMPLPKPWKGSGD